VRVKLKLTVLRFGMRISAIALRNLNVPTLVIHGDEDPIISFIHGIVCARVIPGAKLHIQKGVGHEIPLGILAETIPIILKHLGGVH
jgi:pimeloyl-ACP methyl ester carboxylesterase